MEQVAPNLHMNIESVNRERESPARGSASLSERVTRTWIDGTLLRPARISTSIDGREVAEAVLGVRVPGKTHRISLKFPEDLLDLARPLQVGQAVEVVGDLHVRDTVTKTGRGIRHLVFDVMALRQLA